MFKNILEEIKKKFGIKSNKALGKACNLYFNEKMVIVETVKNVPKIGFCIMEPFSIINPEIEKTIEEISKRLDDNCSKEEYLYNPENYMKKLYKESGFKGWRDFIRKTKHISFYLENNEVTIKPARKDGDSFVYVASEFRKCKYNNEEFPKILNEVMEKMKKW